MAEVPKYYEKYFDEKFKGVYDRLEKLESSFKGVSDKVNANERNIFKLGVAMAVLTPVYIKESRDVIIGLLAKIVGF